MKYNDYTDKEKYNSRNNQNNYNSYDDEINLRDYILVVLKYWKLISVIFFIGIITASFIIFSSPKIYQAQTIILVTPSKIRYSFSTSETFSAGEKIDGFETPQSTISVPTHKELLKSNIVIQKIIDKLNLTDQNGKKITPYDLNENLEIETSEQTSIIKLIAKNNDPVLARDIVNTWAVEYIEYSQDIISGEVKSTGDFIKKQFNIVSAKLLQTEEEIRNFKNKYDLDLMGKELAMNKDKLNKEKEDLMDIEIKLQLNQDLLSQLQTELKQQEKYITVSKAITDDALWSSIAGNRQIPDSDSKKLTSQIINPIYQDLEKRIVNTQIDINVLKPKIEHLKKSISKTTEKIDNLKNILYLKQSEFTQMERELDIYKNTYKVLSDKIEKARIITAAELDEVKIVSFAFTPERSVSSLKIQKIGLSGLISIIFGVFLAFFVEFIRMSDLKIKK